MTFDKVLDAGAGKLTRPGKPYAPPADYSGTVAGVRVYGPVAGESRQIEFTGAGPGNPIALFGVRNNCLQ